MPYDTPADPVSQTDAPATERSTDALRPMTDDAIQAASKILIEDAESFVDGELQAIRIRATQYYQGLPFGNEVDGRSKVVLTELRDVVTTLLPPLMAVFFGPEQTLEFLPNKADPVDTERAEQETEYISEVVIKQDNSGFMEVYSALKDGLVRTTGVIKWWHEPVPPRVHRLEGISEEQLTLLMGEPGVTLLGVVPMDGSILGVPQTLYEVEVKVESEDGGMARFAALPPEEFIFSRDARSRDQAQMVGHRTVKTTSELLDMGVSLDDIIEHGGLSNTLSQNAEAAARNPAGVATTSTNVREREDGELSSTDQHDYYEIFPYMDVDGDGHAELRRVCLLGPGKYVVLNEPADERPFAIFVPDPEPHTIIGLSADDYVADIQRINSFILRAALDSLSANLNPRYEVVEDKVTMSDVLSHELGLPVRVKEANTVRPLTIPFAGDGALAMLEFMQGVKENRIGVARGSASLSPDALQSTSQAGVIATMEARQRRIELFARIFAETGLKQLARGLRRMIVKHPPRNRIFRFRGKYVEVDPRSWEADRDVRVNVALGLGFADERVKTLMAIAADQKEWITALGPANPLVGIDNYRNTMARVLKLSGFPNADEFYKPVPPGWQPPPPPPAPPDPAMVVAQAEVARTQAEIERKNSEFALKGEEFLEAQRKNDMEDARARQQLDADIALRAKELELKYGAEVNTAAVRAQMELDREHIRQEHKLEEAKIKAEGETAAATAGKPEGTTVHVHVPPPAPAGE